MTPMHWLLRAKRWSQNPPSAKRVVFIFAIVATCLALVLVEKLFGLPAWMQINGGPR
ncbi:hypothetical protein [Celeribacter ethanolicus]|jgi:hypothetical protein|uniref:hypothetical protein n=1 Tax=Celeribacter ethanolicus TaxID=1758178 RepID=UPI000A3D9E02|nr:hypothetical protein [Celeribacter ethanolicus]